MEWKHHCSPATRKFKVQKSVRKVMASVFWDKDGLLLIDYLPPHTTITDKYYSDLLVQLREAIKKKRRRKLAHGVIFLQDNAPVHTSRVAQATLRDCGFQLVPHPPYSPDLAASDFFLFRKLKNIFVANVLGTIPSWRRRQKHGLQTKTKTFIWRD